MAISIIMDLINDIIPMVPMSVESEILPVQIDQMMMAHEGLAQII